MANQYATDLLTAAGATSTVIPLPPRSDRSRGARPIEGKRPNGGAETTLADGLNDSDNETIDLRIEFGRAYICRDEVQKLRVGSVVPLDSVVGDLVELYAGGRLIARGETIALNGNFGVRVVDVISRAGGN